MTAKFILRVEDKISRYRVNEGKILLYFKKALDYI